MAVSDEVKAQVIASLLSGEGVNELSRRYKISNATVSRIRASLSTQESVIEHKEHIDDLLLSTLADNMGALSKIANTALDIDYLKKQGAVACATLYGEIASVTLRLLEAASAAGVGETPDTE